LYQVTRNAIIDRLRSSRAHEELPQGIAANNEECTAEARLASFLQPMIEVLPEIYRDVVILSSLSSMACRRSRSRDARE
jgi:DNA-directed RNA polymerase specialized sigma24 family protein